MLFEIAGKMTAAPFAKEAAVPRPNGSDHPGADEIGRRIAQLRKERGMTQVELARKLRITQPLLSKYEQGRVHLPVELLAPVARLLRVSTDELLSLKKPPDAGFLRTPRLRRFLHQAETLSGRDRQALLRFLDAFLLRSRQKTGGLVR